VTPVLVMGRAWKWQVVTKPVDGTVTYRQALRSYVGCLPLAIVSPGRLGEYARSLYLPQKLLHGMVGAGRVFLDNWTDSAGLGLWASLGWLCHTSWENPMDFLSIGMAPVVGMLCLVLPVRFWMGAARSFVAALPRLWGLRDALGRAVPPAAQLPVANFAAAVAISVGVWGLEWLQASFLLRFLGSEPLGFALLGGILALVAMANTVQVTFAGLGVREGVAAYLLSNAGIDFRAALVAAFCQTLLNQMLPAMAGLAVKPPDWPERATGKEA
jgi:uncharacterized membrane protein YbhN (UPF0104 family)